MTNLRPLFFAMFCSVYLLVNHPIQWLVGVCFMVLILAVLWLGLRLAEYFSGCVLWHRPRSRHHDPPNHTSTTSPVKPLPHEVGSCQAELNQ
jgi:hypothetical protein